MKVEDLKIIVTGAASGMGRHFAGRLAELGAGVAAADLDEGGLATLVAECADLPGVVVPCRCDVSDEDDVEGLIRGAADALGGLNGLVNNAGIFRDALLVRKDRRSGELRRMSLDQWQAVIDVDLTGPFLCTRGLASYIVEREAGPGVVVNISSVSRHGNPGQSNYAAAKAGLVADTKLWSLELARYGIRVGAVAPGFVDTPILQAMRPEVLEGIIKRVPLRRMATPEEIFQGVRFIIECDYYTGRCIDIDGGLVF